MEHLHYTILFHEEPEGGFTATVPVLPGCVTYGKDLTAFILTTPLAYQLLP